MRELLSVIVPIYNVKDYLDTCIQGIISSSYINLEIILVDDGSTDGSGEMCNTYARQDERIKVIHKRNGGLVSARKAGVAVATGKYVTFVDGDDYIDSELYKNVFNRLNDDDEIDMVCFSYDMVNEGEDCVKNENFENKEKKREGKVDISNYNEIVNEFYEIRFVNGVVVKLFKTDILKKTILFVSDDITKGEDLAITLTYLNECNSILYAEDISGYYYVQRSTSISHKFDVNSIERTAAFVDCIMKFVRQSNISEMWEKVLYNECYSIIMSDCVGCCFKHYGRLKIIHILIYYRKMCRNKVIYDFYNNGVRNQYFANSERMKYAYMMVRRHFIHAFLLRIQKRY